MEVIKTSVTQKLCSAEKVLKRISKKTLTDKSRFESCTLEQVKACKDLVDATENAGKLLGTIGPQTTWQISRDVIFADTFGIEKVNRNKHGFDVMHEGRADETKHETCTFNDTTIAKIEEYEKSDGYLWLVHWSGNICDYAYRLPLNNKNLTDYLRGQVISASAARRRSTQKISISQLISWGAIKILPQKDNNVRME
jgi:hypothetical protein